MKHTHQKNTRELIFHVTPTMLVTQSPLCLVSRWKNLWCESAKEIDGKKEVWPYVNSFSFGHDDHHFLHTTCQYPNLFPVTFTSTIRSKGASLHLYLIYTGCFLSNQTDFDDFKRYIAFLPAEEHTDRPKTAVNLYWMGQKKRAP